MIVQLSALQLQVNKLQMQVNQFSPKIRNSSARNSSDTLEPVPNGAGAFPVAFPATFAGLRRLSNSNVVALVSFYELNPIQIPAQPQSTILDRRRYAIATHIGIRDF